MIFYEVTAMEGNNANGVLCLAIVLQSIDIVKKKLVLFALNLLYALWWGGFTFYAAIVVPQGMKILGDHIKMGLITQSVTNYLNAIGVVVLISTIVLKIIYYQKGTKLTYALGWDWVALALLQAALFYLHHTLSSSIHSISDDKALEHNFYLMHRIYLLISTAMWLIIPLSYYRLKTICEKIGR